MSALLIEGTLGLGLVGLAVRLLWVRDRFESILLFITFGLLLSMLWAWLGSGDVALAEAAIGAGLSGALLLAAWSGTGGEDDDEARTVTDIPWSALCVASGGAAIGVALQLAGEAKRGALPSLAQHVSEALTHSGVESPVTAVLLNFRGYDTLLEVAVLVAAWLAATEGPLDAGSRFTTRPPPARLAGGAATTLGRLWLPLALLVSAYLVWVGSRWPGGAFQAAALLAGTAILVRLVGLPIPLPRPPPRLASWAPVGALAAFTLAAAAGLVLQGRMLAFGFFLEEQKITVERGRLASLRFDFNPDEVAVVVSVTHGERPARGARVALRDDPNSLRYLRDENVYFYLREGEHIVCAGAGDRATEKLVRIESLAKALKVSFDLDDEDSLMIAGAEAAVEPYLLGDFESAARALDAAGEEQRAHLMRGAHYQQRGELERAASEYEAAGCIEEAAQLRASSADPGASAQLFEQAGDYTRAAEAHRAQGAFDEAARCYEAAYDWDAALECWEAAGDLERVAELHEKQGSYLEAAKLAVDGGHFDRALENLQQIERRDSHYAESCRLTADVLAQRGEFDLAAERQAEAIALAGGDTAPAELHERHAELLAQTTDKQAALDAYQTVRRLDPRRSDVTQHIETLRSELTSAQPIAAGRSGPEAAAASRYELIEEIGRGGMGVVYKARDTRLGRIVALKRLPHELRDNETAARLFLREARAAASLNHPNIVTVYDADEENGEYHITMELLEGLPINVIQERRNQINVPDAARIGIQVCAGLQYAHERRIVHRDIKTANLFFTRDKVVKIMDFGLAKTIEEVRKNSTVIGGTPYYMAPEQAAGGEIGPATDLYALGVTLHRLLTGTFPFTDGDLAYHHRHTPPPDPRQRRADLPEDVARLILDLLEKEPSRRPACATDVAQRLQALLQS